MKKEDEEKAGKISEQIEEIVKIELSLDDRVDSSSLIGFPIVIFER